MRHSLWLACILMGLSCASNDTRPSPSPEYLRCLVGTEGTLIGTEGTAIPSDTASFGSKPNPYDCKNDATICATLGANFSCDAMRGCCKEMDLGRCSMTIQCGKPEQAICNLKTQMCEQCSAANEAMGDSQCATWAATAEANYKGRTACLGGTCVECRISSNCKDPLKPVCDQSTNTCKGCAQNSDCPSQVCKLDPVLLASGESATNLGQCVKPTDAAFVDNTTMAGGCSNTGTGGVPYCQITDAINAGKSYITVRGNGATATSMYQAVTVNSGRSVFILGPGRDVQFGTRQALINGVVVSPSAQLTLIGISVTNSVMNQPAIQCGSSSTLYVQNVLISKDVAIPSGGISASSCSKVYVERTKITGTTGYGISITGGSGHRIVNNAIINNGSTAEPWGLKISGSVTGLFAFNTIAGNTKGVTCDSQVPITDSIVQENIGTQIMGCQPTRVETMNAVLDQTYTTGSDPKLTSSMQNDTCCINKAVADPTVKDDYLFIKRPLGTGYDLGAYEAR